MRIVISKVCPSIPNQVILNKLKNINIIPISEIAYLKAGINIEGYEHIILKEKWKKEQDAKKLDGGSSFSIRKYKN